MITATENKNQAEKAVEATMEENPFHSLVETSRRVLGLHRPSVGVTFFYSTSDYERSPSIPPARPLSFCMMVKLAAMGRALKATKADVNCPGARRALGMSPPDSDFKSGNRYLSFGLYKNLETARAASDGISLISRNVRGLAVQPLSVHDTPPDVVILICSPYQAMRIIQGYAYHFGPAPQVRCNGMQGVCAELTARSFQTQDINVSLLCSNTRFSCAWGDAELGVGMPFQKFLKVIDGVIKTVNSVEPNRKKKEIIERSGGDRTRLNVKPGKTYYWRRNATRKP